MLKKCYLTLGSLAAASSTLAATAGAAVTLMSGGSTFIYPILVRWTEEYRKLHPDVLLSYDPVGSGKGISRTIAGTVDCGASDGPLTDAQMRAAPLDHAPLPGDVALRVLRAVDRIQ